MGEGSWYTTKGVVVYVVREYDRKWHRIAVATKLGLIEGDAPTDCTVGCVVEYQTDDSRSALPEKIKYENPLFCNLEVSPAFGTIVITYKFVMDKTIPCSDAPALLDLPILNTVYISKTSEFTSGEEIKLIIMYYDTEEMFIESIYYVAIGWIDQKGRWKRFKLDPLGPSHASYANEVYDEYCELKKQGRVKLPLAKALLTPQQSSSVNYVSAEGVPGPSTKSVPRNVPQESSDDFDMGFDVNQPAANSTEIDEDLCSDSYFDEILNDKPKKTESPVNEPKKPAEKPEHLKIKSAVAQKTHNALIRGAVQPECIIPRANLVLESIARQGTPEPLQPNVPKKPEVSRPRRNIQENEFPVRTRGASTISSDQLGAPVFENERSSTNTTPKPSSKMGPPKKQPIPEKPQVKKYCPVGRNAGDDDGSDDSLLAKPTEEWLQSDPPIIEEPPSPALSVKGEEVFPQNSGYVNQPVRGCSTQVRNSQFSSRHQDRPSNYQQPAENYDRRQTLPKTYEEYSYITPSNARGSRQQSFDLQPANNYEQQDPNYVRGGYAKQNQDYQRGNRQFDNRNYDGYGQNREYSNAENYYQENQSYRQQNFNNGRSSQHYPPQQNYNNQYYNNYRPNEQRDQSQNRDQYYHTYRPNEYRNQSQNWEEKEVFNQQGYYSQPNQPDYWNEQGTSGYFPQQNYRPQRNNYEEENQYNQPPPYQQLTGNDLVRKLDSCSKDDLIDIIVKLSGISQNRTLQIEPALAIQRPAQRIGSQTQVPRQTQVPQQTQVPRQTYRQSNVEEYYQPPSNSSRSRQNDQPEYPRQRAVPAPRKESPVSFFPTTVRSSRQPDQEPIVRPSSKRIPQNDIEEPEDYQQLTSKMRAPELKKTVPKVERIDDDSDELERKKEFYSKITKPIPQSINQRRDLRSEQENKTRPIVDSDEDNRQIHSDHINVRRQTTSKPAPKSDYTAGNFRLESDDSSEEEDNDSDEEIPPAKPALKTTSNTIFQSNKGLVQQQPQTSGSVADAEDERKKQAKTQYRRPQVQAYSEESDESTEMNDSDDSLAKILKPKSRK